MTKHRKQVKVNPKSFGLYQQKLLKSIVQFYEQNKENFSREDPFSYNYISETKKKEYVEHMLNTIGFLNMPAINLRKFEENYPGYFDQYYFHPAGIFLRMNYAQKNEDREFDCASSGNMEVFGLALNEIHNYSSSSPIITPYGMTLKRLTFTLTNYTSSHFLYTLKNIVQNMAILEQLEEEIIREYDPFYISLELDKYKKSGHDKKSVSFEEQLKKSPKLQEINNFYQQAPVEFLNFLNVPLDTYFKKIESKFGAGRDSYYNWRMNISDELHLIQRQKEDALEVEKNIQKKEKKKLKV